MWRRTAWAVLVPLVGLAAACSAQPAATGSALAEGRALVERAERALEQGNSPSPYADPAVETLKRAVSQPNPAPEAYYYLGRAYALAGHPEIAARCLLHYLDLNPAGQEDLRKLAHDYVLRTEFVLGCEALSMGRGRTAEAHFAAAARMAPENPLIARKLESALSGKYDASHDEALTFAPEDPENPMPLVVPRGEVFPRFAHRAIVRLATGDLPGAGADIDKVMAARGTNATLAGLRAAIYFQSGEAARAMERFGPAFGDPVVPTDLPVLTTRVASVAGSAYRVSRVCEGAVLSMLPYLDRAVDRAAIAGFLSRNHVVAVSRVGDVFALEVPPSGLACRLRSGAGAAATEVKPLAAGPPKALLAVLDPDLVAQSRILAFPRTPQETELRFVLREVDKSGEVTFEEPPLAAVGWSIPVPPVEGGTGQPTSNQTPPSGATVAALADACLPVYSRTAGQPEAVRAVWMTDRFLEALCRLSGNAPDIADLRALRKAAETHLVFMVMAPDTPQDEALAKASALVGSQGDRRFGAYLDTLTGVPGLSARAKAYGVAFPIASRTGKALPLDQPGELTLLLGGQEAPRFRFSWQLPLVEPALLRAALGEAPTQ
jgi:hypothetical protein